MKHYRIINGTVGAHAIKDSLEERLAQEGKTVTAFCICGFHVTVEPITDSDEYTGLYDRVVELVDNHAQILNAARP